MPQVQTPDPGRKMQTRYRTTGHPEVFSYGNEIVPVALVDALASVSILPGGVGGVDPLDTAFERPCAGFRNQSAGAGDAPNVRIVNEASSGVVAIFESFLPITNVDCTVAVRLVRGSNLTIGATAGIQYRDGRLSGTPALGFLNFSAAPVVDLDWQIPVFVSTRAQIPVELPYVLDPGDSLEFRSGTINHQLGISLRWRERQIPT